MTQGSESSTTSCHFCAEQIQSSANKCKFCGELLNDSSGATNPQPSIKTTFADKLAENRVLFAKYGIRSEPIKLPTLKQFLRTIGNLLLYILGYILFAVIETFVCNHVFEQKYAYQIGGFLGIAGIFVFWNLYFLRRPNTKRIYKFISVAVSILIFVFQVGDLRGNLHAIDLGWSSAISLDLAKKGGFKDQASLDHAIAAGFDTRSDEEIAEKAGFHDQKSYDKFNEAQKAAAVAQNQADLDKKNAALAKKEAADKAAEDARQAVADTKAENTSTENQSITNSGDQIGQLVSVLGPSGYARCAAGDVTILALIARGDQIPAGTLSEQKAIGPVLEAMRSRMLLNDIPADSLDDMVRKYAVQIRSANDPFVTAFQIVDDCTGAIAKAAK